MHSPIPPSVQFPPFHAPFSPNRYFPFSLAHPGFCLSANVKGATVPTRHVHHLPGFGANPCGLDLCFSVRYEPHAFRGGDGTLRPQARLLRQKTPRFFLSCRWLSPPTQPYPSAISAHESRRRHTTLKVLWQGLGKAQARAPPRTRSSRGDITHVPPRVMYVPDPKPLYLKFPTKNTKSAQRRASPCPAHPSSCTPIDQDNPPHRRYCQVLVSPQ